MGKPILQIPKKLPTEEIVVDFSPLEREFYDMVYKALQRCREEGTTSKGVSRPLIVKREKSKLWHTLRSSTSHAALVKADIFVNQAVGTVEFLPDANPAILYQSFCRTCRNVLDNPQLGPVSFLSPS